MTSSFICTICEGPWAPSCREHPWLIPLPRHTRPSRRVVETVNCPTCGKEFLTGTAAHERTTFCSRPCAARTATARAAGTFVAAPPVRRELTAEERAAERLAQAIARNPEAAARYGLPS